MVRRAPAGEVVLSGPAYWAWARDGSAMHVWRLTENQVQQAKASPRKHTTACGKDLQIGEKPKRPPRITAEYNHCPACWAKLCPRPAGDPFLPALVRPDIPQNDRRLPWTG